MDDSDKTRVNVKRSVPSAPPLPRNMVDTMRPAMARSPLPAVLSVRAKDPTRTMPDGFSRSGSEGKTTVERPTTEVLDQPAGASPKGGKHIGKFKAVLNSCWRRKLWVLPLTIMVVLVVVLAIPASRYKVLAFFVSKTFSVTVIDSTTDTPVSGAVVKLAGRSATTDSSGQVHILSPVGDQVLTISKTYYKGLTQTVLVDITGSNALRVRLIATGRQVPVKVVNAITGKPIPEVVLTFGDTNAKTDLNGQATVVLPTSSAAQDVVLTVDGYNNLSAKVQVTTQVVAANTFAMVPKGRIYFLSDLSGRLDIVSTNLDGSGRETVLAGTGSEDRNSTVLLASRDWQYLALLSKRDGSQDSKLYLINTNNGQFTTIDSSAGSFTPVGWDNHYFVYSFVAAGLNTWQPGYQVIKSYDADGAKSAILASAQASGTSATDEQYQSLTYPILFGGNLVYTTTWWGNNGTLGLTGQQNTLVSVQVGGTGTKTLESVDAGTYYIATVTLADPTEMYFAVDGIGSNTTSNFYRLDNNQNVTQSSTITSDNVSQAYPTYLLSPSGKNTFWSTVRDGKNTLFVGDGNGNNGNQIASLSDYSPYGWYTDDYLLVQKSGSELYIFSANGGTPQKVSDYFKPDYSIYGYGGGYGGF